MVAMKRALALHIGGDGPEQRRRGLVRAVGPAQALDRLVGPPARLQQVVDPALGIGAGKIGVITASGAPGHGEHQDAFPGIHEGGGLGEVGGGRPRAQRQVLAARIGNSQHPARPAGHFRDRLVPEVLHDLVQRRGHRRERRELLDQRVAAGDRLLAEHGVAVIVEHRPREQVAAVVGEGLLQLHREGVGQELDDGLPRGEVDGEVVPFGRRDLGDAPLHQRLAGRDQLDDRRPAGSEIGLDRADQRRALHGGQQMAEEALLGALECRERGRLGVPVQRVLAVDDSGGLQGLLDVPVDDLEGAGIGVVDAPLFRRQLVFEDLDLDAVIGERPGLVEAEGLEIARDHFHRRDSSRLHGGDELDPGLERRLAGGPETQSPCIGEAGDGGGAGRRDIGDARVGQRVLEPEAGAALLGRLDLAAVALRPGGIGHGMRLVEDHRPVEGMAVVFVEGACQPCHDLIEARGLALAGRRTQRGVGGKEDALGHRNLGALAELAERDDVVLAAAERAPVASRVLDQLVGL